MQTVKILIYYNDGKNNLNYFSVSIADLKIAEFCFILILLHNGQNSVGVHIRFALPAMANCS